MHYQLTTATRKLGRLSKRIRAVVGGTSASKTVSILLLLIAKAQTDQTPTLTSITAESIPHLKRGAMRDFLNIMQGHGYYQDSRWNKTDFVYTFETGSKIEFFSTDSPDKARGPRRDRLYMNEANNQPYGAYEQMEVRTKDEIWLDWNPTNEFWFYTDVLTNPNLEGKIDFVTLTYLDNEALDAQIVSSIESRKPNKAWWTVYGLGQLGEVEGRVFTGWNIIDEIPDMARLWRRGLDYGYSNDPTTIVSVYEYDGGIIVDEELYQTGMANRAIADFVKNLPAWQTLIKPDSSEPKSNDELKTYGLTVVPAQKGQGSVNQGIQKLQGMKVQVTSRSTNLLKEYRNYMWQTDKEGKVINVPMDAFNHCMDAIRYAVEDRREEVKHKKKIIGYRGGDAHTGYGKVPIYG